MPLKRLSGGVPVSVGVRGRGTGRLAVKPAPVKSHVGGLVVTSVSAMDNGINHILFRLLWSDIEPVAVGNRAGAPIGGTGTHGNFYDWTTTDAALASLPAGSFAKFGVQAGDGAPQWLRDATGTVNVLNTKDGTSARCAHFWEPVAQDAWADLMNAMAARYDSDPRLKQIIACLHMTNYMEPFILGSDSASDQALWNAGLESSVSSASSISTMLDSTLAAWKNTRVELPLHTTWEVPKGTGTFINQQPWATLRDFINPYEQTYGERIMFTDYGLGHTDTVPVTGGATLANATTEYEWMRLRGFGGNGPVGFQITDPALSTPNPLLSSNVLAIVDLADQMNGCYLEHSGYGAVMNATEMAASDAKLKQNAI